MKPRESLEKMFLKIGKVIIESTIFLEKSSVFFGSPGTTGPPSISWAFCLRRCFQFLPLRAFAWKDYIDT